MENLWTYSKQQDIKIQTHKDIFDWGKESTRKKYTEEKDLCKVIGFYGNGFVVAENVLLMISNGHLTFGYRIDCPNGFVDMSVVIVYD